MASSLCTPIATLAMCFSPRWPRNSTSRTRAHRPKASASKSSRPSPTEGLGIEIEQTESDITLCHTKYIEKLAETFLKGEANRKEHKTPACQGLRELVNIATGSKAPVDPDNKGAIDLCKDCVSNDRTKHIELRHLKLVQEATTSVKYMASQY